MRVSTLREWVKSNSEEGYVELWKKAYEHIHNEFPDETLVKNCFHLQRYIEQGVIEANSGKEELDELIEYLGSRPVEETAWIWKSLLTSITVLDATGRQEDSAAVIKTFLHNLQLEL